MTTTRADVVYRDPAAELAVVGCAIDNDHGSRLAHARLNAGDFDDQQLARLFAITPDLPIARHDHAADPTQPILHEVRIRQAAVLTGLPERDVAAVCASRVVMSDETGFYARRVAAAAETRRHRQQLLNALDQLDSGDHLQYSRIVTNLAAEAAT